MADNPRGVSTFSACEAAQPSQRTLRLRGGTVQHWASGGE